MRLFPVFLCMNNRECLVVGAGTEAQRRADALIRSGARVTLMAAEVSAPIKGLHKHETRNFQANDPAEYWLVVAATENADTNAQICAACAVHRTFCYDVDNPATSTYFLPAIIDRSPLLVAISSGGAAPALVRRLKAQLDTLIPTVYAQWASAIKVHRSALKQRIPSRKRRARFWQHVFDGPLDETTLLTTKHSPEQALKHAISTFENQIDADAQNGFVSLVGAGPGDPDLLTLRALRLIQSADVLVYDRLVSQEILDFRRQDAELLYAGKAKSDHAMPQSSINQLLVDLAREHQHVVRLKGGDPFIFGRGGEEIGTLARNRIPFQVVPGITAASGCAAFAGIPLTHRDHAQSCVFVTGHLKNGEINLNWQDLRDSTQTIVIYMGLTGLSHICNKLIEIGRSPETPAALVEQGTTPRQQVHLSTVQNLAELVSIRNVRAPTLLIIGSVVTLHDTLKWFNPHQIDDQSKRSHFSVSTER